MLTGVDVALLLVIALAVWAGWRSGATGFAFPLAGAVLGLLAGLLLARWLVSDRLGPLTHLLLGVLCVLGAVLIGRAAGRRLAHAVGAGVRRLHLGALDRASGAALRGGLVVGVCWLLAGAVVAVGTPAAAAAVQRSVVLSRLQVVLPAPGRLVDDLRGGLPGAAPADLLALVPADGSAAAPGTAALRRAAREDGGSVLKVLATGCGGVGATAQGTGFVAAASSRSRAATAAGAADTAGLVVTNAHVVRGSTTVEVTGGARQLAASVVLYDPAADLAVLRVPGLEAPALPLAGDPVVNGTSAVVLGYPQDGPLTATGAVVVQRLPVGQPGVSGLAVREVYRLHAQVRHGNSGSPLLTTTGQVVGVVNSQSLLDADTGFALTLPAVRADLAAARAVAQASSVSTGSCAGTDASSAARG